MIDIGCLVHDWEPEESMESKESFDWVGTEYDGIYRPPFRPDAADGLVGVVV